MLCCIKRTDEDMAKIIVVVSQIHLLVSGGNSQSVIDDKWEELADLLTVKRCQDENPALAIYQGDWGSFVRLIRAGVDPNSMANGYTCLGHLAACPYDSNKHVDPHIAALFMDWLIKRGADAC